MLKGRVSGIQSGVIDAVSVFPAKWCLTILVGGVQFSFELQLPDFNFPF